MRTLLRPTPVLLLMCVLGCSPAKEPPLVSDAACDVALTYLKEAAVTLRKPIAVTWKPSLYPMSEKELDDTLRKYPQNRNDPAIPYFRAARKARDASIVDHCPGVRAWLGKARIIRDDKKDAEITRQIPWSAAVVSVSAPIILPSGDSALVYVTEIIDGSGGERELFYQKKPDGRWSLALERQGAPH